MFIGLIANHIDGALLVRHLIGHHKAAGIRTRTGPQALHIGAGLAKARFNGINKLGALHLIIFKEADVEIVHWSKLRRLIRRLGRRLRTAGAPCGGNTGTKEYGKK